jgi:hypothetical protein
VAAGTAGSSSLARRDNCRLLHLKSTIERGTGGGDERRNEKEEEVERIWVSRGVRMVFFLSGYLGPGYPFLAGVSPSSGLRF